MKFDHSSLKIKILIPIIILQLILALTLVAVIVSLRGQRQVMDANSGTINYLNRFTFDLVELGQDQQQNFMALLAARTAENKKAVEHNQRKTAEVIQRIQTVPLTPEGQMLVNQYLQSRNGIDAIETNVLTSIEQNNSRRAEQFLLVWSGKHRLMQQSLAKVVEYNAELMNTTNKAYQGITSQIYQFTILAIVLATIFVFGIYSYLNAIITKPIRAISAFANQLSSGNFNANLPYETEGEIGSLITDLKKMRQTLRTQYGTLAGKVIEQHKTITQHKVIDQRKDEFLTMASHELKTPLTSMKAFVELLDRESLTYPTTKGKQYVGRIKEQIERLGALVDDLLDVSRIKTGNMTLTPKPFSLTELVSKTASMMQLTSGVPINHLSPRKEIRVVADEDRINQVLLNFLSNAIKYSPNSTPVIIKTRENDGWVKVSVTDHGLGINKAHQDKIFSRFYRVPKNAKKVPGLGMGLYISKQIIKGHKGEIGLKSEPGKGSTFYFTLPALS